MIRYVLTGGEISFLCARLGLKPFPTFDAIEPTEADALVTLRDKGLVFGAGDRLSLEMVAALLMRSLCLAERIWEMECGPARLLVYQRGALALVVAPDGHRPGGYLIGPARDREGLVEGIIGALDGAGSSQKLAFRLLRQHDGEGQWGLGNGETTVEEFSEMLYGMGGDGGGSIPS